jgi:hypothetical protein
MVVLVLVPDVVLPPGLLVRVQVPEDGSPLSITVPVDTPQVGCEMVPGEGAPGVAGAALIVMGDEDADIQPATLVTV